MWRGCKRKKEIACTRCTETIKMLNKEEMGVVVGSNGGVKKEAECSCRNVQKGNGALKGHGTESIKGKRTESTRSVQKILMQTEQCIVAE
jgi:hypothetical protein